MAFLLLIDSITGFFLAGPGIDLKLSAGYKLLLLSLVLFQIGVYSKITLAWLLALILLLMVGPGIVFLQTLDIVGFLEDFITTLKLFTPVIIFLFCALVTQRKSDIVLKYGMYCCFISFLILLVNLILGVLGFGFASYGASEIGVKGFFYAGNEVSGLYIVFFGFILHRLWQKNTKRWYLIFSLLTLLSGLLIATKAAMIAGALLIFFIPLVNDRNRLFNLTWLKVKLILPVLLLVIVLFFFLLPILESAGILGRLLWFYEKKGIVGLLFSGRDEFIAEGIDAFHNTASFIQYIFGFGRTGLGLITKESMEVDPIDMFFWFGFVGISIYSVLIILFFKVSYQATLRKDSIIGGYVFLVNIILVTVSLIAGHIFTSGMLGPFIGLINGMAYADLYCSKKTGQETV